ncbi:transposase [uncultured Schumannella sp.]|uniref:transposase n=1 Tax=uncultured Schumannella sp. TaxID=1195956 RepID=UPI00342D722A
MVPGPYPAEFRVRAVALVRSGRRVAEVAYDLGLSAGGLSNWVRQDRIDRGGLAGRSTTERAEPRAARERI